jgi:hypothetical protein
MGQDYQTEAYPQPGSEPSDYPQNGFGDGGFGPSARQNALGQGDYGQGGYGQGGYGQNGLGQDPGVTQVYGTQPGYGQNGFAQNDFGQDGFGQQGAPGSQATYTPDGYSPNGYGQDSYGQGGYPQDPSYTQDPYPPDPYGQGGGYGQQGFEQPPGLGYDDGDAASRGHAARSRPGARSGVRPPQRLSGMKMALYLGGAVIGVVAIVYLVIQLAKSGGGTPATGSSTPSTGSTAAAGGATAGYVLTQAPKVGAFPLNKAVTGEVAPAAQNQTAPVAAALKAQGAGQPSNSVTAVYDMGTVHIITSSAYKGIIFVGYNGTFKPAAVIRIARSHLTHSRVVKAGPHGGDMVCGYNTASGADASECVWVTKSTFGMVEFIKGEVPVKYPGASDLALQVRNAVEVHAS